MCRDWSSSCHGPFTYALISDAPCVTEIAYNQVRENFQPAYSYSAGRHGRRGGPGRDGRMLQLQFQLEFEL
jgi:hypothetical protein